MNNLFLTNLCHNHCPYCFAMGRLKHSLSECNAHDFLSLENARFAARFFQKDGVISFLGGEPTLHPQFTTITDLFLDRGYRIFLFSNATFGSELRNYLQNKRNVYYVLNISDKKEYSPERWNRIRKNLETLRPNINSFSVTLYQLDQDVGYLPDLAEQYDVKAVKIGIAAPSFNGRNQRLSFEQKHLLAAPLLHLAEQLSRKGIIVYGECEKLKPCMVKSGFAEQLMSYGWQGHPFKSKPCLEGGNIDIGPDLRVWRCYPFSTSAGRLPEFSSPEDMRGQLQRFYQGILFRLFSRPDCYDCLYALTRHCEGGCLKRTGEQTRQRLTRYFKDLYLEAAAGWRGQTRVHRSDNPFFTEWFSSIFSIEQASTTGRQENCTVVTDAVAEFDPLHPLLLDISILTSVFPAQIHVDGIIVQTERDLSVEGWRKTLWNKDDKILSGPFLIYTTDMRTLQWYCSTLSVEPGPDRALVLFYTTCNDDGRVVYSSDSPHGYVALHPLPHQRSLDIGKDIYVEPVQVSDQVLTVPEASSAKSRVNIS